MCCGVVIIILNHWVILWKFCDLRIPLSDFFFLFFQNYCVIYWIKSFLNTFFAFGGFQLFLFWDVMLLLVSCFLDAM